MATIQYNGKTMSEASDMICFASTPNIITISSQGTSTKQSLTLDVSGFAIIDDSEVVFNLDGHSINGVNDLSKATNRQFFCNSSDKNFLAISMINAMKNVPQLAMNYNFEFLGNARFRITSKNDRTTGTLTYTTKNITGISTIDSNSGSNTDGLVGKISSRVYVDLYYDDTDKQRTINSSSNDTNLKYITTLEKEYYKDKTSFNITPVISSLADYGNTTCLKATLYSTTDGVYQSLGDINNFYVTKGYLVNQGNTYIDLNGKSVMVPALNVKRGNNINRYNNSRLYIYDNRFEMSYYHIGGWTSTSITISYLESDETEIETRTQTITADTKKNLQTMVFNLDENLMREAYFIDITFPFGIMRYDVINPPFANAECNRVYWYNSYGGVSFFDFTGKKVEERKINYDTYNTSILDYYNKDKQEQAIVYDKNNDITVSLTTHLIDKDGLYQLYDLASCYSAWIKINNVDYNILIDAVTVNEPSDNVYTVTVKYKYSLLDEFA